MPDVLTPHPAPLTAADARHLLRRTGFGAPPARVAAFAGLSAPEAARRLLDEATAAWVLNPAWYGTPVTNLNVTLDQERENLLRRMTQAPLRERMTLFWHNHFATEVKVYTFQGAGNMQYGAPMAWAHYRLLRDNALGNFRTLVTEVGLDPAMLRYLNGDQSTRTAPNQNYARELLELFTMGIYGPDGQRNYTDTDTDGAASDVVMAARALTGWQIRPVPGNPSLVEHYFNASRFDAGTKTFLGQTGPWGYGQIIAHLFEQRAPQIARFVSRKLLSFFVCAVPDPDAEAALADLLVASNFEVRPALEALFASAHFYGSGYRGALVKSPTDLFLGLTVELQAHYGSGSWVGLRKHVIQPSGNLSRAHVYFQPPDVAGWPGHNPPSRTGRPNYTAWYTAEDFPRLWEVFRALVLNDDGRLTPYNPLDLLSLAPDPNDAFHVARSIAEYLLALSPAYASLPDRSQTPFGGNQSMPLPGHVAEAPPYVVTLTKMLLDGVPFYEWPAIPEAHRAAMLRAYVFLLVSEVPEFLLM